MAEDARIRSIGMSGIENARELGGIVTADGRTVKKGLLLRTGKPGTATPEDIERLKEVYHLETILDLRSPMESKWEPDPEIPGVTILPLESMLDPGAADRLPDREPKVGNYKSRTMILLSLIGDPRGFFEKSYREEMTLSDLGVTKLKIVFDTLKKAKGAVLFHCASGKDRTGITAMMILTALGVPKKTIIEDYMLTNVYVAQFVADMLAAAEKESDDPGLAEKNQLIWGVQQFNIEHAFDAVEKACGSVENFLRGKIGLTDADIDLLKDKYLD